MIRTFEELFVAVQGKPAKKIAVVSPEGTEDVKLLKEALERQIAGFVLVGNEEKIKSMSTEYGLSLDGIEVVDKPDQKEAAEEAVRLVVKGQASALLASFGSLCLSAMRPALALQQRGSIRIGGLPA
jgi:phosphate butyryltransferase